MTRAWRRLNAAAAALGLLVAGGAMTSTATPAGRLLGDLPPPLAADQLVDPREYPAFARRPFAVPTWETFGHRPQLVGGRYHGVKWDVSAGDLVRLTPPGEPLDGRHWFIGRVYRPDLGILHASQDDFVAGLTRMRDAGLYLFNVGGYGPGSPWKGSFGQAEIPAEKLEAIRGVLGERFLGFDLGEQDGRYHNAFELVQLPRPRDAVGQQRLFHEWCDRVIDDQGGKLSLLTVLWNWHQPIRDGAMTVAGAECQNKDGVTNAQVQYAFLRGAGRQHGVLWFGDVSVFSTFGLSGWELADDGSLVAKPGGNSANLMRRLFLSQWLWNSCILGFEGSIVAAVPPEKRPRSPVPSRPSPIGIVQMEVERLIQAGFKPGVMQAPVAVLFDGLSGWMPPRTNRCQFRVWNDLPYAAGDHFADGVLSLLYPGYEDNGWYMDERGAMAATPHGDIADCLLGDASVQALSRYGLVICAGITTDLSGVRDRLDAFTNAGGTVLAIGDDAARLWPEWFPAAAQPVAAGATIAWHGTGRETRETEAFSLREISPPGDAAVLASCGDLPAVVRVPRGAGSVIVLCSATGLAAAAQPCEPGKHAMWGGANTGLERPFPLLRHVREALDEALASQRLFTAGAGLTVTTCRRDARTFTVGVANPGLRSRPFAVASHIGPIAKIEEVPLGPPIHDLPGYWPHEWGPYEHGAVPPRKDLGELRGESAPGDPTRIGGGDMRLFTITLADCTLRTPPAIAAAAPPIGRFLAMPDLFTLRPRLLAWPMFAQEFEGVAVSWEAVRDTDAEWLKTLGRWLARHGIRCIVNAGGAADDDLPALVEALGGMGGRVDLVRTQPTAVVETRLRELGINLRAPTDVMRFAAGHTPPAATAPVQILESDWRSWETIYRDARSVWLQDAPEKVTGRPPVLRADSAPAVSGPQRFLAVHDAVGPEQAVAARPDLENTFNGLMLDAEWILARSAMALDRDRAWLESHRMEVIIDFTRSINRFPDLTFSPVVPHRRAASIRALETAIKKMTQLGARHAVACSHMLAENENDWAEQRAGIEAFLHTAAQDGITVHWRASRHRPPGNLAAHAALVQELRGSHPNLRMAACTVEEPDAGKLLTATAAAGRPELWLVAGATPEPALGTPSLPLTTLAADQLAGIMHAAGDEMVVADADYASWDEVQADMDAIARANASRARDR